MQSLFEAVKATLHITVSDLYDEQVRDLIAEAKLELIRSGVSETAADNEDDPLLRAAVKAYCQMRSTEDPDRYSIFQNSFTTQQDCLRKAEGYGYERL